MSQQLEENNLEWRSKPIRQAGSHRRHTFNPQFAGTLRGTDQDNVAQLFFL
jgi:hypothetical protein